MLPWEVIAKGFRYAGEKVHFLGQTGIFKPKRMSAALSIRTPVPSPDRPTWYSDQVETDPHTGLRFYALARPKDHFTNRALGEAIRRNAGLVYFIGVEMAGVKQKVYEPIWPVWPVWAPNPDLGKGRVMLAAADALNPTMSSIQAAQAGVAANELRERSYSLVLSKQRNHQAWFSSRTKSAYGQRCAFSGLPLSRLLVGAHILPDAEDGPATVTNGICMSTLHHTAFDTHLIGVDTDCRVHVARTVRDGRDGPLLQSLKGLHGARLRLPDRPEDRPDREFLDWRFERFRETAD